MAESSFIESHLGMSREELIELSPEARAQAVRASIPDLGAFLAPELLPDPPEMPPRTRELAKSLYESLAPSAAPEAARSLGARIITDPLLRSEADRDQNVYLGPLFTRRLTHAVPDLIFLPVSPAEATLAVRWARARRVPLTIRGAASTAMGGAVPRDAGLVLDLSRLDGIEIDRAAQVCVIGAGARLRAVHAALAAHGLALRAYPSNLGGTFAGWFATGGIGLNAFGAGRALDQVRAADVLLAFGQHVRFHDDGRLDVPDGHRHRTISAGEARRWFQARGVPQMTLADLAGSEGVFGAILQLTVRVEPRPEIAAFLLGFDDLGAALKVATVIGDPARGMTPANLKLVSGSHLEHVERVWEDESGHAWRDHPGELTNGATLPWRRIVGPRALGATCESEPVRAAAWLYVDFFDLDKGRAFAAGISEMPWRFRVPDLASARFAADRFRPQQIKRLGPGMLAAEILLPASEVGKFLPRAEALARRAGNALDAEVYFLADRSALAIAGVLTDHRSAAFTVDLVLAPALLDLAMAECQGRPYVLGRWQAAWFERKFGREEAARIRTLRKSLDIEGIFNPGVLTGLELKGALGALVAGTFAPGIGAARRVMQWPALAWIARAARTGLSGFSGHAHGRGAPARIGATFRVAPPRERSSGHGAAAPAAAEQPVLLAVAPSVLAVAPIPAGSEQRPEDRALHCVNCGECNSVCPIFHESGIRLPQMLTHLGEALSGGIKPGATGATLLDLCMRCGNCEQVCQAGIPHLPMYERLQRASDAAGHHDVVRHTAIVAAVRGSNSYQRDFLGVRPGGYQKRAPVSLPGLTRFLVLRAENDAGPAATCIHCGACVTVCPTHANREFAGADPRWIETVQERCIGCGSCVEVCPNNQKNGGQTLRVMEAPAPDWFAAVRAFERAEREGAEEAQTVH